MKKITIALFVTVISVFSFAQIQNEVRASMGIDFVSVPSLKDYIDQLPYEQLADFNAAVDFSGSYGRMISESYQYHYQWSSEFRRH
jgi:hypothetical protein